MFDGHLPPGFRRVFRREIRQILAHPAFAALLLPYPLLIFLLLSVVFHSGMPTSLPIAVVDLDASTSSRQVVRMVDASSGVSVKQRLTTLREAKEALVRGDVYSVLYVPEEFERDLFRRQQPELVVFSNSQLLTAGGQTARAINTALLTLQAGASVTVRQTVGQSEETAMTAVNRIPVQFSALFNPKQEYISFLLAAAMPAILQIFITGSTTLALSRDRHSGAGMERLVRLGRTPLRALAGKLAPYTMLWLLQLVVTDAIIFGYFETPFHGNLPLHFVGGVLFVLACQALGATFSLISRDTLASLGLVSLFTAPAFGFAGLTYPRLMMNTFAVYWGAILPLTPFLQLRVDQILRGAPFAASLPTLGWSVLLVLAYSSILLLAVKKSLKPKPLVQGDASLSYE